MRTAATTWDTPTPPKGRSEAANWGLTLALTFCLIGLALSVNAVQSERSVLVEGNNEQRALLAEQKSGNDQTVLLNSQLAGLRAELSGLVERGEKLAAIAESY